MSDQSYNAGHFEKGVWIPDCKRCGACCRYQFFRVSRDDEAEYKLLAHYQGTRQIGNIAYFPAPCRFLGAEGCLIHEEDEELRPACCNRFGYGGYHHPSMCAFFGGNEDREYYPDDYRHRILGAH